MYKEGDETEFIPENAIYRLGCCDCGLVHDIKIKKSQTAKGFMFTIKRNNRATGQLRRYSKFEKK